MQEFKYDWCWWCDCATINSPNNKENTCCAFWHEDKEWSLAVKEFMDSNPFPHSPSQENIDDWVKNISICTENERLILAVFGKSQLMESYYYNVRMWTDKMNLNLPSLEELSIQTGEEVAYDCKTGEDWAKQESKIHIINPTGWNSEESFKNERIPWRIFCHRRKKSECQKDS